MTREKPFLMSKCCDSIEKKTDYKKVRHRNVEKQTAYLEESEDDPLGKPTVFIVFG